MSGWSTQGWQRWFQDHWRIQNRGRKAREAKAQPGPRRLRVSRRIAGRRWFVRGFISRRLP